MAGGATGRRTFPVADAVRTWADEGRFYDASRRGCRGGVCGHYTQLIWRATTHVGCGAAVCPQGALQSTAWVCNLQLQPGRQHHRRAPLNHG